MSKPSSPPKKPLNPLPVFAWLALERRGLMHAFLSRPLHQQNDYLGWIVRAKRQNTQQKRLAQMLDELQHGYTYMGMPYEPVE